MVFCGRTGFKAAMAHAPVVDGKERYVFWVAPHIAFSGDNEVGKVWRPGYTRPYADTGSLSLTLTVSGHIFTHKHTLTHSRTHAHTDRHTQTDTHR